MRRVEGVDDLRGILDEARAAGRTVGFVPTMGYFHEGHLSLVRAARAENDVVVVSIFVNPLQFGEGEDLDAYPRDPEGDAAAAEAEGVDVLFVPSVDEMYPRVCVTTVRVAELSAGLCGAARPTHFDGVATVVSKLFSIVGPCRAYFGTKDFQQLAVVRRLVADLSMPVEVVGCPLVREPDGVAMSSRNAYLGTEERRAATVLHRALVAGVEAARGGERDADALARLVAGIVASEPRARLEYAEVVSGDDLGPVRRLDGDVLVAVAARIGRARLIDNVTLAVDGHDVVADLGVDTAGRAPSDRAPKHRPRASAESRRPGAPTEGRSVRRTMMKSKIHRATVTGADLNYVGSITLDTRLMELADLREHEQVHVLDLDNGQRFETYVIPGDAGDVVLNGAAARLVHPGDRVIVISYGEYEDAELEDFEPKVVFVDSRNRPMDLDSRALDRELHDLAS